MRVPRRWAQSNWAASGRVGSDDIRDTLEDEPETETGGGGRGFRSERLGLEREAGAGRAGG